MSNKFLTAAVVILSVVMIVGAVVLLARKNKPQETESSAELSEPAQTEIVIVPATMPERFTMTVPNGFTETSSERFDKYYIHDDASIIVTGEKIVISGELLGDYVEDMKRQYAETADDYKLISEKIIEVDGVECRLLEFRYAIKAADERQGFGCLTGVLIKDDFVYIITCKSHEETFAAYADDFRKAIRTVVIKPAESEPAVTSVTTAAVSSSDSTETTASWIRIT